eukprot:TRINITY_DN7804_c0_g1_i1.p1 TRINITY_DN7804_c0_g1~~TRINITY_DN7804_c0_g1_i1.p1  ORF type:complete len:226 (-),score=31.98 TRINITY_DN7804_c0_g1_i1:218-895(-)
MTNYDDDKKYAVELRVRNTFYELYAYEPSMVRCKSEPALSFAPGLRSRPEVQCSPELAGSQNGVTSVVASAAASAPVTISSKSCRARSPSQLQPEQHTEMKPFELSPYDTTIMVRDLPCMVGYQRMMLELKSLGLDGCYDYIFFPKSYHDKNSFKGFCFINFMTREALEFFMAEFAEHNFEDICSEKKVCFGRADVQGLEANLLVVKSSRKRVEFRADPAGLRAA